MLQRKYKLKKALEKCKRKVNGLSENVNLGKKQKVVKFSVNTTI